MPHHEISLPLGSEHFDAAVGLLHAIGFDSFLEDGDTLKAYIDSARWTELCRTETRHILKQLNPDAEDFTQSILEEKNWNEEWEASLTPIRVSDKLVIIQKEKSLPQKEGEIHIEINPKMSFGTGYHETTRLMLRRLEKSLSPDDLILDIGTGTGVLAIAARLLGNTRPIVGCDNDSWSVENAEENCRSNKVSMITIRRCDAERDLPELLSETPFSLVLANVNILLLQVIIPLLRQGLCAGSRVMMSGVLKYDEDKLNTLLHNEGFMIEDITSEGEWIAVEARLKPSKRN